MTDPGNHRHDGLRVRRDLAHRGDLIAQVGHGRAIDALTIEHGIGEREDRRFQFDDAVQRGADDRDLGGEVGQRVEALRHQVRRRFERSACGLDDFRKPPAVIVIVSVPSPAHGVRPPKSVFAFGVQDEIPIVLHLNERLRMPVGGRVPNRSHLRIVRNEVAVRLHDDANRPTTLQAWRGLPDRRHGAVVKHRVAVGTLERETVLSAWGIQRLVQM